MSQTEHSLHSVALSCHLAVRRDGAWLDEFVDRARGQALLPAATLLCQLAAPGGDCGPVLLDGVAANEAILRWPDARVDLRVRLEGPAMRLLLTSRHDAGLQAWFPFLDALRLTEASPLWLDERSFHDGRGRPIVRHADWPLPLVQIAPTGRTLTALGQGVAARDFALATATRPPGLAIPSDAGLQLAIHLHDGGWPAAFALLREHVRNQFDLAQYACADLAWLREQLVQHFTFLYGREILNLDSGQFEVDRFLDEGERTFGGYDGFLIWGVYPRIGVDERTQWEFYDDFPGGRAGLRQMARRARERGVRFFIPYKPWDRSADIHGRPVGHDHEQLARPAADVEADGVFLDTMSAISPEFRAALDQARPGVAFCSEGRAKGAAFQMITSSWDQSPNRDFAQGNWSASEEAMPGVDLWRFIFPEHRLFVINRHAVGDDRIRIIQRGFFSGMGWVVWQDIFGLVLTYAPEEAALLKKCRTIFREHLEALNAPAPTPLIATLQPGVYANEFPASGKRLWTFYNENDRAIQGAVLRIEPRPGWHCVDVWRDREAPVDADGHLAVEIDRQGISAVVELPRRLLFDPQANQIGLAQPLPGATIQVRQAGREWSIAADGAPLEVQRLRAASEAPLLIRLLKGNELLDQIVVPAQEEHDAAR